MSEVYTMKECRCPDYIDQCVHVDGVVLWMLSIESARTEYERRCGQPFAGTCIACGSGTTRRPDDQESFRVYGPSLRIDDKPDCYCRAEIQGPWQDFLSFEDAWQFMVEASTQLSSDRV